MLSDGRPSSTSVRRTRLHVSRRSRCPRRRVWEEREEVKEDSVLGGEGDELGGRRRGQEVGTGDEWDTMGLGGQRS
jgi:hypothetical protein